MAKQLASKEVTVLARGQHKLNPKAICYLVLSSNGKDKYETIIYDGKCTSCQCRGFQGYQHCYHGDYCIKLEALRCYDVVGEAVKVYNRAVADAQIGDFYEQRAKDMRETLRINFELSMGI